MNRIFHRGHNWTPPFFPKRLVHDQFPGLFNRFFGHISIDLNGRKPFGFDIEGVDGIAVDQNRLAEVDRLQKGIAEALNC
jgi:hypothetical protein